MRLQHGGLVLSDTSGLTLRRSGHLAAPCSYLREVLLLEVMNVCHCVKTALLFFVLVKDQRSDVRWQPDPPSLVPLQRKDRLPIFLSPVLGPGP